MVKNTDGWLRKQTGEVFYIEARTHSPSANMQRVGTE
jgi:hypothetical protein